MEVSVSGCEPVQTDARLCVCVQLMRHKTLFLYLWHLILNSAHLNLPARKDATPVKGDVFTFFKNILQVMFSVFDEKEDRKENTSH